jgi:hypothetical protein
MEYICQTIGHKHFHLQFIHISIKEYETLNSTVRFMVLDEKHEVLSLIIQHGDYKLFRVGVFFFVLYIIVNTFR